jgi:hypothetical protein
MDRLIDPATIVVAGSALLWTALIYCTPLGYRGAIAVLATFAAIAVAIAAVELVVALIDRAAGRGEGL